MTQLVLDMSSKYEINLPKVVPRTSNISTLLVNDKVQICFGLKILLKITKQIRFVLLVPHNETLSKTKQNVNKINWFKSYSTKNKFKLQLGKLGSLSR